MLRLLAWPALLTLAASPALAQPTPVDPSGAAPGPAPLVDKPIRFGGSLGINGATMAIDTDDDLGDGVGSRSGIALTAFVHYSLNPSLAIQAGVRYSQRGYKFTFDDGMISQGFDFDFEYIDLPVIAVGRFPVSPTVKIRALGGGYFGLNIKASAAGMDLENVASTDLGITLGGGADFAVGTLLVIVDLRFDLGLQNIVDDPDVEGSAKHRVLSLTGGVAF